jgi:hypothetical protein
MKNQFETAYLTGELETGKTNYINESQIINIKRSPEKFVSFGQYK